MDTMIGTGCVMTWVAYIGPGAGLSAIGSVLALLGALVLMVVGFVWYPVKRLLKWRKRDGRAKQDAASGSEELGHDPSGDS